QPVRGQQCPRPRRCKCAWKVSPFRTSTGQGGKAGTGPGCGSSAGSQAGIEGCFSTGKGYEALSKRVWGMSRNCLTLSEDLQVHLGGVAVFSERPPSRDGPFPDCPFPSPSAPRTRGALVRECL